MKVSSIWTFSLLWVATTTKVFVKGQTTTQTFGTITGQVLEDVDCDKAADAPLADVQIELCDENGNILATTLTSSNGEYEFDDVPGDTTYVVKQVNLPGFRDETDADLGDPNSITVTLAGDLVSTNNDFTDTQCPSASATIRGSVLDDSNCDGEGDTPIAGSLIQLIDETGNLVATTLTSPAGKYEFNDVLGDAAYIVKQTNLPDFRDESDADDGDQNAITVTLAADLVSTDNDFTDTRCPSLPASLLGSVLEDVDCDGLGDMPIAGSLIQLCDENGSVIATTLTSADGVYSFHNVQREPSIFKPSTYILKQVNLPGFKDVGDTDGGNPGLITVIVAPRRGGAANNDFVDTVLCDQALGAVLGAVISGQVTDDRDCNGTGDLPIVGCVIQLCDEHGSIVASTETSTLGEYEFADLRPGTFVVKQINLPGFKDAGDVDGGDPNRISVTLTRNQVSTGHNFVDTSVCEKAIPFIQFAYPGYKEPSYFQKYENLFGQEYMKRCVKREGPPREGDRCRAKPKACLFGEQTCPGGNVEPTTRCNCKNRVWSCQDFQCPTIDPGCPLDSPTSDPLLSVCSNDLTCAYGAQDCCGSDVPSFAEHVCACQAGTPFDCFDFDVCDSSCPEVQAFVESTGNEISSKYPDLDPDLVIYDDVCDPDTNLLVFLGVEELLSYQLGSVAVTWSPGYAVHVLSETYYECGDSTYDVFVAPESFNFEAESYTNAELVEQFRILSQTNSAYIHRETSGTSIDIAGLRGGEKINVLVLQKMADFELFSFNREPSSVQVSAFSPELNPSFTKFANVPEDGAFTVTVDGNTVTYTSTSGNTLPPEVINLEPLVFAYIVTDVVDQTILAQFTEKLSGSTANMVSWRFAVKALEDIYDELDLHSSVNSDDDPEDQDGDDEEEGDVVRRMEWHEGRRRLGLFKRIKKGLKKIKKAFKKIAKAIKKIAKAAKTLVKFVSDLVKTGEAELEKTLTILDVERGSHQVCMWTDEGSSSKIDIGARLGLSLKLNLSVTVSIKNKLSFAGEVQLIYRTGASVFFKMTANGLRENAGDPVLLWQGKKKRKNFQVGPVPVIVSTQPTLHFFHAERLKLESEASASAEMEYVVTMTFGINKDGFYSDFTQTQEFNLPRPILSGRLSASLEAGLTLALNAWLYSTVRGTAALDAGARFEAEMSRELETIVVAPPWYVVEKFDGELFLRVKLEVGLDGPFIDIIKNLKVGDGSVLTPTQTCKTESYDKDDVIDIQFENIFKSLEDPMLNQSTNSSSPLSNALSFFEYFAEDIDSDLEDQLVTIIKSDGEMVGQNSVNNLISLLDSTDLYKAEDIPKGISIDLFSKVVGVELLDISFPLFGLPTPITLSATEVSPRCQSGNSNAVVLRVTGTFNEKGLFLKGTKDHQWYADLDGRLLGDDSSAWVLENQSTDTLTLRLPRNELGQGKRTSLVDATVYLRATPELLPFLPGALYAKGKISDLWGNIANIECCQNSDCPSGSSCEDNNMCQGPF